MADVTLKSIRQLVAGLTGASAVGVCRAEPVDDAAANLYDSWIASGCHAEMAYLERYGDVRSDPRRLLEGARTIVVSAFSYANPEAAQRIQRSGNPQIAEYALGSDYHTELRRRLQKAADTLSDRYGGRTRICIDTAPLRERYWAVRAGLGFTGLHNQLIIPGHGAHFFLATILWTGEPADSFDSPCTLDCGRCGECVKACPTGALSADGRLDARKCLSYLTIESRDAVPDGTNIGRRLFGCDTCRRVCPHEATDGPSTAIPAFRARADVLSLTVADWLAMTDDRFREIFRDSAVRRAKLPKLLDTLSLLDIKQSF